MSMGTNAAFAEQVKDDVVAKVVGEELYKQFEQYRTKAEQSDCFSHGDGDLSDCEYDYDDEDTHKFVDLADEIQEKFKESTGIGITLKYHGDDCGDIYDEVVGWYWDADFSDLYQKTPAFKAFEEKYAKGRDENDKPIERQFFTIYG